MSQVDFDEKQKVVKKLRILIFSFQISLLITFWFDMVLKEVFLPSSNAN